MNLDLNSLREGTNFQKNYLNKKIEEINNQLIKFVDTNFTQSDYSYQDRNDFENVLEKIKETFDSFTA